MKVSLRSFSEGHRSYDRFKHLKLLKNLAPDSARSRQLVSPTEVRVLYLSIVRRATGGACR